MAPPPRPPPAPPFQKKKSFITDFYSGSNLQYFFKQKFETIVLLSSILAKKHPTTRRPLKTNFFKILENSSTKSLCWSPLVVKV